MGRDRAGVGASAASRSTLLADLLVPLLPEGPPLYPEGDLTDEPEQVMVAELIREAALEGVRDELPHSIAVVVEEMLPREDRPADRPLLDIHAYVYIERPSQKGIIIGPKGERLKEVGIKSRKQIEALLGTPVFLDLHVKVAKDWQRDPQAAAQARLLTPLGRLPGGPRDQLPLLVREPGVGAVDRLPVHGDPVAEAVRDPERRRAPAVGERLLGQGVPLVGVGPARGVHLGVTARCPRNRPCAVPEYAWVPV